MDEQLQLLSPERRQAVIDKMTLTQKAEHDCLYLSDYLSIKELCDLMHPISWPPPKDLSRNERAEWNLKRAIAKEAHDQYKNDLLAACEAGLLQYEGDIKGWEYFGTNPHPLARKGNGEIFIPDPSKSFYYDTRYDLGIPRPKKYKCPPDCCTIHKNEFKRYLQSREQWPVSGLLANWWINTQDEVITEGQTITDDKDTKNHRQLLAFLKPIFNSNGKPTGVPFLKILKKHENRARDHGKGPIIQVITSADAGGRGFRYDLGNDLGLDFYTLSNLQKRCSEWKKEEKTE